MEEGFYNDLFDSQSKKSKLHDFVLKYNCDYGLLKELSSFCEKRFKNPIEVREKFETKFKKFDFYFNIGTISNFTNLNNVPIRGNELIPINGLRLHIRDALETRLSNLASEGLGPTVVQVDPAPESWSIHIEIISSDLASATEYAHIELTKSIGILKFVNGGNLIPYPRDFHPCYVVFLNSEIKSTYINTKMDDQYFLLESTVTNLISISNVFKKLEKNDIDRRIIKAFDIYCHVNKNTDPLMKIVFYMTMLENLLLDKSDKDYLNWKLAERVAFLIGNKPSSINDVVYKDQKSDYPGRTSDSKYVINDLVRKLYKLRSQFVHSSESVYLDKADKFLLIGFYIVEAVLYEFLKLESKNITELRDSSKEGSKGLINLIEIIKYDKNPTLL